MQRRDREKNDRYFISKIILSIRRGRKLTLLDTYYVLGTLLCYVWTLTSPHKCLWSKTFIVRLLCLFINYKEIRNWQIHTAVKRLIWSYNSGILFFLYRLFSYYKFLQTGKWFSYYGSEILRREINIIWI